MGVSQELKVTRSCDVCQKSVTFIKDRVTEEQLKEAAGWFVLTCEHLLRDQLIPIAKLACSKHCALQVLHKDMLDLPSTAQTFASAPAKEPVDLNQVN